MSERKAAFLEAAIPILSVTDLTDALDYYERVLGFQIAWKWGEPPHLASVCRDRVEVNLKQPSDTEPTTSNVYFRMAGIDGYYAQLVKNGAQVAVPIADRAYGMRDFRIIDHCGNQLSFGEIIES